MATTKTTNPNAPNTTIAPMVKAIEPASVNDPMTRRRQTKPKMNNHILLVISLLAFRIPVCNTDDSSDRHHDERKPAKDVYRGSDHLRN